MPKTKAQNILVGNAGEYYVCAELNSRGIIAVPTQKNTAEIDILASKPDGSHLVALQVKTMGFSNKYGWKLGTSIVEKSNTKKFFVVLVNLKKDERPDFYVVERNCFADLVESIHKRYMNKKKKDGTIKKNPGFRWCDIKDLVDNNIKKDNWEVLQLW